MRWGIMGGVKSILANDTIDHILANDTVDHILANDTVDHILYCSKNGFNKAITEWVDVTLHISSIDTSLIEEGVEGISNAFQETYEENYTLE